MSLNRLMHWFKHYITNEGICQLLNYKGGLFLHAIGHINRDCGKFSLMDWGSNGLAKITAIDGDIGCFKDFDLMRPWVDKKPTDIVETGTYTKQRNNVYLYNKE